jgi:hypothetical protein
MVTDWLVQDFRVQEDWKCASMKIPKARRVEVMGHDDVS